LTTPYAFNADEAKQMADAGADIVVAHMGLTTKGAIGATSALTLEQSVEGFGSTTVVTAGGCRACGQPSMPCRWRYRW